jgi:hypothetical protein
MIAGMTGNKSYPLNGLLPDSHIGGSDNRSDNPVVLHRSIDGDTDSAKQQIVSHLPSPGGHDSAI